MKSKLDTNTVKAMLSDGRFATVYFVKRSTGAIRRMRCRAGVRSALKGGRPAYDADSRDLVHVYDLDRKAYRSIPVEGVTEIRARGYTLRRDVREAHGED